MSYEALWASVLASLTIIVFGFVYAGVQVSQRTVKTLAFGFAGLLGAFVVYALAEDFRIGDPGLRIVWQLAKGLGAGIILLVSAACWFSVSRAEMYCCTSASAC